MDFGRLITAMVTPFTASLEVDYHRAQELANHLVDNGSDGIVVAGTTGESPTLSKTEKIKLFAAVMEAVGHRATVIAGTGSNDTLSSIALSKEAEAVGVHGLLLVGPYYNKPTQEGYYRHFAAIAQATKLPIMLYNVPGRTGSNILPSTIKRLAALDNIVATKEAAGNMDQFSELVASLPDDFRVYSGDDGLTLPLLSVGGYGIVSVAGHLVGRGIKAMIDAYVQGRVQEAAQLHCQLFPMFKGLFQTTNPIGVKEAMNMTGFSVGGFRLPLVGAEPEQREALRNLLAGYNLI
ncbi:4-hydroxy-tetrahydrodipicolinate synthase [Heliophilum fasciatum]|uniref:4-hydroxy-tetrahydrodipicolinate synthase n=1 Tax=Heliophilum fasciatum TaxID=35700 RepID=A0A4R2RKX7_9FIRM|nr:4-hydroxy-tetrahydrodipicolinate synthase [Heliophilum fasciatum]MCW2277880.1 4-hydroxy-tetrahydrodipicolinate synthase [Heliophilum fasciatum]TCP64550.1 4-hydroxy-tetrahydrodipicolinate synthase [Heliophilum fasciatum]